MHRRIRMVDCLLLAGLLAIAGPIFAEAALASDDTVVREVRPARERLIEYWLIGGSDRNPARRDVGKHQIGPGGWPAFVEERARPAYDWGMRRFWVHNPFGTVNGKMDFDQYLQAHEAGLGELTREFGPAWKPIVDGGFGEPTELVVYMGVANFQDGSTLQAIADLKDPAATLAHLLRCLKPVLEAGASLGADASARLPDNGPTFDFYQFLEGLGMEIYIESRPRKSFPGWARFNVVAEDGWWNRSDPEKNPDIDWPLPEDRYEGSVVRIMHGYDGSSTDRSVIEPLIARIRAALLEGHSVAFRSDGLRKAGIPMSRLTEGIDEQLGVRSESDAKVVPGDG